MAAALINCGRAPTTVHIFFCRTEPLAKSIVSLDCISLAHFRRSGKTVSSSRVRLLTHLGIALGHRQIGLVSEKQLSRNSARLLREVEAIPSTAVLTACFLSGRLDVS